MTLKEMVDYHEPWACTVCGNEYRDPEMGFGVDLTTGEGLCNACMAEQVRRDTAPAP